MNTKLLLAGLCSFALIAGTTTVVLAKPAAPASPAVTPASPAKPAEGTDKGEKKEKKEKNKDEKGEKKDKDAKGAAVGTEAPKFDLKSFDGKQVKLDELLKTNKAVVVQWFNPGCPYVKMHYENGVSTFNDLYTQYNGKGVAFVGINSGAKGNEGASEADNKKAIADWKISYPILVDDTGATGKAYGAKTTPHMFIITADGKVAYNGAIDNNQGRDKKPADVVNYVKSALDEILASKPVTTTSTKAYGCSVKYAK